VAFEFALPRLARTLRQRDGDSGAARAERQEGTWLKLGEERQGRVFFFVNKKKVLLPYFGGPSLAFGGCFTSAPYLATII
jgi:hypothetical protein